MTGNIATITIYANNYTAEDFPANTTIFTVPSQCCPPYTLYLPALIGSDIVWAEFGTNGDVKFKLDAPKNKGFCLSVTYAVA